MARRYASFREFYPTGHLHLPALQSGRRLPDVRGHDPAPGPLLARDVLSAGNGPHRGCAESLASALQSAQFMRKLSLALTALLALALPAVPASAGAPTDQLRKQVDQVVRVLDNPALKEKVARHGFFLVR